VWSVDGVDEGVPLLGGQTGSVVEGFTGGEEAVLLLRGKRADLGGVNSW